MSITTTKANSAIQAQAEEIVASGADVRSRLTEVVTGNACTSEQSGEGLVGVIQAVMDGARAGLARAVPNDRENVLRQIVDALGDGVSQTALAGRLAVQEAVSASRQYTKEDLARFRDNLTAVRELFTETVEQGLKSGKAMTASQISAAKSHASRVAERIGPAIAQALEVIGQHPAAFAREGLAASVSAGQSAAGSLFDAFGRMLVRAGTQMRQANGPNT
jgi:hypothetical protein